ncbi:MAG: hypothetical protein K2Y39_21670 [Candidatus Obscuribacterales bacterium]|nr:hypothetical protein [Candidatus Obscuribacterales bacterium]
MQTQRKPLLQCCLEKCSRIESKHHLQNALTGEITEQKHHASQERRILPLSIIFDEKGAMRRSKKNAKIQASMCSATYFNGG